MKFRIFDQLTEVSYGLSRRSEGTMKLTLRPGADHEAINNRERFFVSRGINRNRVVAAEIAHGSEVLHVSAAEGGSFAEKADGLVTNIPGLVLSITVADCFPVFLVDPRTHAIGLVHAGWRGIKGGIIGKSLRKMIDDYSVHSEDVLVGIGPGLNPCHFEVKADVAELFLPNYGVFVKSEAGRIFIDLPGIIEKELTDFGVVLTHIERTGECTYENSARFFSHRREPTDPIQAMAAYLVWQDPVSVSGSFEVPFI